MVNRITATLIFGLCIGLAPGLGNLQAAGPDFTDLVEDVVPAVVNIQSTRYGERPESRGEQPSDEDIPELFRRFFDMPFGERGPGGGRPDRTAGGSGFIIGEDGLIITNHHVIEDADEIIVRLADRREYVAELVGSDAASDIALLRIDASDLPVLPLGDSDTLRPGQWVIGVGSPFNFEQSVTAGIVSATGRTQAQQQYVPFIQTDVAINRGNSGGPLVNMDGEVVGINSWILSSHGGNIGLSFSIPVNTAQDTVEQLLEYGRVSRGLLGVEIGEVNREKADALDLDRPRGALINGVRPDSSAETAGVEVGDVILTFDGRPIEMHSDLPPAVGATRPGREVELEIWRWGERKTLTAVLDELEDGEDRPDGTQEQEAEPTNALGLGVESISEERRRQLGDPEGGVLVGSVDSDRAYRAGVRQGDVLLMINNQQIAGIDDFNSVVESIEPGRSVALLIWRNGSTSFIAYTPETDS